MVVEQRNTAASELSRKYNSHLWPHVRVRSTGDARAPLGAPRNFLTKILFPSTMSLFRPLEIACTCTKAFAEEQHAPTRTSKQTGHTERATLYQHSRLVTWTSVLYLSHLNGLSIMCGCWLATHGFPFGNSSSNSISA